MATGGWVADLHKKEHKNWVMVGCALNITKNGITTKIQTEMETWYQSLMSSPPLSTLSPCTCAPRAPKCPSCCTWELELTRHHTSKRSKICWGNSDRKQWGSPTGAWEVAKVFMPILGSRKRDVVDANTTDIGGLLNLLEWCPFIKPPVSGKVLSLARDECRNHWAHAPKQELHDADVLIIFGHLNNLLSDPVFNADKAAQNASKELQDLFRHGLVNVRDSEVEALYLLRQSLVADLTKCQNDLADVQDKVGQLDAETTKVNRAVQKDLSELKEQEDTNREEINSLRQELCSKMSMVLIAVDDFNSRLNEKDDLKGALEVIRDDVHDVRTGMRRMVGELSATKSQVVNLETKFAEVKCEVEEVKEVMANKVAFNRNTIRGLQRDVMDVKEEVETMKEKALQMGVDDGDVMCTAPCRLPTFTGRKSALKWLESNLVTGSGRTSPCTKTICGLGGCGKTSLAVEFAWRFKNDFPGGVFWINGESDENIQKSVVEILSLVNIPASTVDNIDDTLNRCLVWLSKKKHPWLLVVDNADDLQDSNCPTGIKKICRGPWQRNGNASRHGHILLTTRQNAKDTRSVLKLSGDDCLELQCFSEEEGALFLMQRTSFRGEYLDPEALFLAKELGALPLALDQAAAYISASPIPLSCKDYLDKFKVVKLRLLKQQPATALTSLEAQHRLSVHTTWEMNFEFVKEQSPAAASMMHIAAFLKSENIPIDVINPGFPELDQEDLREGARSNFDIAAILRVLSSYSLFSVNHQSRNFSVHKLVQEVVRDSLTTSRRMEAMVAGTRLIHWALRAKSQPFFRSAKDTDLGDLSEIKEEERNILIDLVLNFRALKDHMNDEFSLTEDGDTAHILYNDHTLTLCDLVDTLLGNNVCLNRLTAEFCDFHLKVVQIRRNMKPDVLLHLMVSTSIRKRNCTGRETYEEAKKLSQETVQKMTEWENSGAIIQGDTKYSVLEHRASYYALEGNWKKNYEALLELEGLPLSESNVAGLQCLIARAENNVSPANFQCALRRYEKALELARRIYPRDHPELLRILQFTTSHFQTSGKLHEGRKYAEETLEIAKKQPPTSDFYIKGITSALLVLRFFDPSNAECTLLGILKDRWPLIYSRCIRGVVDDCPDIYASIVDEGSNNHVAMVLQGLLDCFPFASTFSSQTRTRKHNRQKRKVYLRVAESLLSIRKSLFGEIHPEMHEVYESIASVHRVLRNMNEFRKFDSLATRCKESLSNQCFSRTRCDMNVVHARKYKDIGNDFFKSGNYSRALRCYNEALSLCPNDAKLLTNRAATYMQLSKRGQSHADEQRKFLNCALGDSKNAINADPSWVKGYYWKAVCLVDIGERGPSLAAAALGKHLFPSQCKQIPAVVERFGSYDAKVVKSLEELQCATVTMDNNVVILVKEGRYELSKALKVPTNAVLVGVGNVQITCTEGLPLQTDKTVYIENITLSSTIESTTDLKAQAKECLNRGQLDLALSLYSKALVQCPNNAQLLTARATTYLKCAEKKKDIPSERQSLLELALKDSEAAITADSSWLPGYCMKARSLAELNRKQQALAATAVLKHLSSGRDISGVSQHYGGDRVHTVNDSDELCCVLQSIEEQLEAVNQVVLLKQGEYNLEKSVEITQPIVMVGQGKVTVSCKTGRPFNFTQEHFVENVELCGDYDDKPESPDCGNSIDT